MKDNFITGIFDSHAHYNDKRFDSDRDELIRSMQFKGVEYILNAGDDIQGSCESVSLAQRYNFIYASVGIHPHNCEQNYYKEKTPPDYLDKLKDLAVKNPREVVAIGEIGLDYYYDHSLRKLQQRFFTQQMELAAELNLPVIIHSRDATADTLAVLENFKNTPNMRGIVHCFSGSAQTAGKMVSLGYYIGFTGVVTFPNARKTAEAAKAVPLDRLLVETDCPYLAPAPHRGKRCDSSMLSSVIQKLAEIKNTSAQEIADVTRENAVNIYSISK
ncbi:MAG: TatD family hydrolase [Oscillospiraceae bacterium]|nr:TatD family hydrolase [Oscillospiraceae bacterium]